MCSSEKGRSKRGIRSWPEKDRPRERMKQFGAGSLSDSELLAILLRNGIPGKDVISLSRELVIGFGGLRGLLSAEWKSLNQIRGLGCAKIASLLAVGELSKRHLRERIVGQNIVRDPESVVRFLYSSLRDLKREIFKVLFLDKGNKVLAEKDLFTGTVDQTTIHPREVLKAALDHYASALILAHNHPSGRVEASREDCDITHKLVSVCAPLSITILDHIIVGDNEYFSFREKGLL